MFCLYLRDVGKSLKVASASRSRASEPAAGGSVIRIVERYRGVIREFLRFTTVGFVALFVDMGALWFALNVLSLNFYFGRVFSFLVAATFTWGFNRLYTFRGGREDNLLVQWAKFLSVNAFGGLVNFAVYVAVLHQGRALLADRPDWMVFVPYLGVAAGSASGLLFNFAASKRLIFR